MIKKRYFILYYLLLFNRFGTLFLAAAMTCSVSALHMTTIPGLVLHGLSLPLYYLGLRITLRYKHKKKYYYAISRRIQKKGFKEEYLMDGFLDPCYRILSRRILDDNHQEHLYKHLKQKYGTREKLIEHKIIVNTGGR